MVIVFFNLQAVTFCCILLLNKSSDDAVIPHKGEIDES